MKKIILNLGFIMTILSTALTAQSSGRGSVETLYLGQSVDDLVIKYMKENDIPGMSLAIVEAPYITRVIGYGLANNKSKRLVSPHTLFPIGQITGAYTAVAIMQLTEAGKISLDDHINKYILDLPKNWHKITIRELISHTSGIPSYDLIKEFKYSNSYKPQQIIDLVKNKPLDFEPGTNVSRSASNYYLLGMIIEKASGMSYQEYVTKYQFEPLKLTQTFFPSELQNKVKNEVNDKEKGFLHSQFKHTPIYIDPLEIATGYTIENDTLIETKENNELATFAHASIVATSYEVSVWDIALAGDILVKDPKNRQFLYHAINLNNGKLIPANAGWTFSGHPGLMNIEGNIPGYTTLLSRFTDPSELICVTLLANRDNVPDLDVLSYNIASAYNSKLSVPESASWVITRLSPYTVSETLERLSSAIKEQGGEVFATVDHSNNAAKLNQGLNEMRVLIFGNPIKGTELMKIKPVIGLDLPLKAMAWKDDKGQVWLSFVNLIELSKEYKISGQDKLIKQMHNAISKAAKKATTAY